VSCLSIRRSTPSSNPRRNGRPGTASPPTPSSPAATPRQDATPRQIKACCSIPPSPLLLSFPRRFGRSFLTAAFGCSLQEAKRAIELENAALLARVRAMQSPERLATALNAEKERARTARREAEEDAHSIQQGHKLYIQSTVTGAVKELASSPMLVVFSICIPEAAERRPATSGAISARPATSRKPGCNITLSEFISFDVGDVEPALYDGDEDDLEHWGMGQNLSGYDDSMPHLDSIPFEASHSRRAADGFRPVVFLELSDMVNVTIDMPQGAAGSRVADTTTAFVGLSMSLEVENFQTWQETPREARLAAYGISRLELSHMAVAFASADDLWENPLQHKAWAAPAQDEDALFDKAVVLDMSDLFVFDHLFEEGLLTTYPVSTGRKRRHDGSLAAGAPLSVYVLGSLNLSLSLSLSPSAPPPLPPLPPSPPPPFSLVHFSPSLPLPLPDGKFASNHPCLARSRETLPPTFRLEGEDTRLDKRQTRAASTLARAWRCHVARCDFEHAMDRLIQDPVRRNLHPTP